MTTTNTWTGAAGTTIFDDGGNWTAGEPNGAQDLVITKAHATVATDAEVHTALANSLTLGATDTFTDTYSATVCLYNGLTNSGTFTIIANGDLTIGGKLVLNNGSSTTIGDADDSAALSINSNTTISGPGHLYLADSYDVVYGTSPNTTYKLENVNSTIEGAADFQTQIQIQNDAGGTIDADISGSAMDFETGNTIINEGLMEANAGGGLYLEDSVTNATQGTSAGVILASGANSYVEFGENTTVAGGTLRTTNGGQLVVKDGGNVNFQNIAINGALQIQTGATFAGIIAVGGEVTLGATLSVRGFTTLAAAAGDINLEEGYDIVASTGGTLQNHILIHGDGTVGDGTLVLDNYGTIKSDTGSLDIELATASDGTSVNEASGTLEAVGGNSLEIFTNDFTNGSSFTNYGSVIANDGSISTRFAANAPDTNRGTMKSMNGGDIDVQSGGALTNYGLIEAADSTSTVEIEGALTNAAGGTIEALGGSITIGTSGSASEGFGNSGVVEASGGGTITLVSNATSSIVGGTLVSGTWSVDEGSTLSFADKFTSDGGTLSLEGSGVIGDGGQSLQASLTDISGSLYILAANYTTTNALSLEGVLQTNEGTFTSGLITGIAGSKIEGSGTIASNIQTAGTVGIENLFLTLTGNDTFSGALTGLGQITFANDTATLMDGVSLGTDIELTNATLSIATYATSLVDTNDVYETGSTFSSATSQTLTLAGTTTLNGGKVTGAGTTLAITGTATSNGFTIDAGAQLAVSGGGALSVQSGTFTDNGTLSVAGAGSAVTLSGTAKLANRSSTTLTSGAYASTMGATMTLTGGTITTDAASITLGNGGTIKAGSGTSFTSLQTTLTTIAAGGTLAIYGGAYTFAKALTLNGTLDLVSPPTPGSTAAVFTSGAIKGSASSTILGGYGTSTLASSLTDAGTVSVGNSANLVFTGTKDTFSGAFKSTGNLSGIHFSAGTDVLAAGASFSDANTYVDGATVQLYSSITDNGNLSIDSGTLALRSAGYTFTVNGASNGISSFAGGTVTGPGTLALNAASMVTGLTVSSATLANTGTMTVGGALVLNKGAISNKTSGTIQLADGGSIGAASGATGTLANAGIFEKTAGTAKSAIAARVTNTGTIVAGAGTLEFTTAIAGTGALDINGGTLQLDALQGSTQSVAFQQNRGTLALKAIGRDTCSIAGFASGDAFDLLTLSGGTVKSFTEAANGTQGTLVVTNGTQTDTLTLLGKYTASNFGAGPDAAGAGTIITYQVPEVAHAAPHVAVASSPQAAASQADFATALFDAAFGGAGSDIVKTAHDASASTPPLAATQLHQVH